MHSRVLSGKVSVLHDRTRFELGVEPTTLPKWSDEMVYVRCDTCSEEFMRERRHIYVKHTCPIYKTISGLEKKICGVCCEWKDLSEYCESTDCRDGKDSVCKKCGSNGCITHFIDPHVTDHYKDHRPRLECQLVAEGSKFPQRTRTTDAGYDLTSVEDVVISPRGFENISTGFILSAPEGWFYHIEGRSSMWKKGIMTFSGTIDSNYCDVVFVGLHNLTDEPYEVKKGDRIGQVILHKLTSFDFIEVERFSVAYNQRGTSGWGSSGR